MMKSIRRLAALACMVILSGCGGGGGSPGPTVASTAPTTTVLAANSVAVTLDKGPASFGNAINQPYVDVTLCAPGTNTCQTIDHILVDTGSSGLRILASAFTAPPGLPALAAPSGSTLAECAQFSSMFLWGGMHRADVKLANENAASIPVQIVGDNPGGYTGIPTACSNTGANGGSVSAMGANGILGVGLSAFDCGAACTTLSSTGVYFGCTSSGCSGSTAPLTSQGRNPVASFAVDNNGVVLSLPSPGLSGQSTLSGSLTFGIGTQTNNQFASETAYRTDANGYFTTTYKGTAYANSFIDSGSNGLFFSDASIPACNNNAPFYCPPNTLTLSAVNTAADNSASGTVAFTVEALTSFPSATTAAFIAGDSSSFAGVTGFDWGLPFFFGRRVFVAINGAPTPKGNGPYWAY